VKCPKCGCRKSQSYRKNISDEDLEYLKQQAELGDPDAINEVLSLVDSERLRLAAKFRHPHAMRIARTSPIPADIRPPQIVEKFQRETLRFGYETMKTLHPKYKTFFELQYALAQAWLRSLRDMHNRIIERARNFFGLDPNPDIINQRLARTEERLPYFINFSEIRDLVSDLHAMMNQLVISPNHDVDEQFRRLLLKDIHQVLLPEASNFPLI
jgi:hypothetical protein